MRPTWEEFLARAWEIEGNPDRAEFAARLGVSERTLYRWQTGQFAKAPRLRFDAVVDYLERMGVLVWDRSAPVSAPDEELQEALHQVQAGLERVARLARRVR